MRIISGKFKSIKLFIPIDKDTRPLKDITKESIFNTLLHLKVVPFKFKNSIILDLYSGTGSFGLECLSREASKVIFVENSKKAIKVLKKNIYKLNVEKKAYIAEQLVMSYLSNLNNLNYKADLIFLDPPYKDQNIFLLINSISKLNILKKNGIILIHRKNKSEDVYPKNFKIFDIKKYGISKIIFGTFLT